MPRDAGESGYLLAVAFNLELKDMFEEYGLEEGANSKPAHYVVEKAFLD